MKIQELIDKTNESFANGISIILRNLDDLGQRIQALNSLTNKPTVDILMIVHKQALENEDYETCEALKIYADSQNLVF